MRFHRYRPGAMAPRRIWVAQRSTGAVFASARLLRARHIPAPPSCAGATDRSHSDLLLIAVLFAGRSTAQHLAREAAQARVSR